MAPNLWLCPAANALPKPPFLPNLPNFPAAAPKAPFLPPFLVEKKISQIVIQTLKISKINKPFLKPAAPAAPPAAKPPALN